MAKYVDRFIENMLFGPNFHTNRYTKRASHPPRSASYGDRALWKQAEVYIHARLTSGLHPSIIKQDLGRAMEVYLTDANTVKFIEYCLRILDNMRNYGCFDDLPSLVEYEAMTNRGRGHAKIQVRMYEQFRDPRVVERGGMDGDIASAIGRDRIRCLDKEHEEAIRRMRDEEQREIEEQYLGKPPNEDALRAELADANFRAEAAEVMLEMSKLAIGAQRRRANEASEEFKVNVKLENEKMRERLEKEQLEAVIKESLEEAERKNKERARKGTRFEVDDLQKAIGKSFDSEKQPRLERPAPAPAQDSENQFVGFPPIPSAHSTSTTEYATTEGTVCAVQRAKLRRILEYPERNTRRGDQENIRFSGVPPEDSQHESLPPHIHLQRDCFVSPPNRHTETTKPYKRSLRQDRNRVRGHSCSSDASTRAMKSSRRNSHKKHHENEVPTSNMSANRPVSAASSTRNSVLSDGLASQRSFRPGFDDNGRPKSNWSENSTNGTTIYTPSQSTIGAAAASRYSGNVALVQSGNHSFAYPNQERGRSRGRRRSSKFDYRDTRGEAKDNN